MGSGADDLTRRSFLLGVGAGAPSLALVSAAAAPQTAPRGGAAAPARFTPWDLAPHFNAARSSLGVPEWVRKEIQGEVRIATPAGAQTLRGIPFHLGPAGWSSRAWLTLGSGPGLPAVPRAVIPLGQTASYLCLAQFCNWDQEEFQPGGLDSVEKLAQHLADAVLVYDDGSTHAAPVRRRFETHAAWVHWGRMAFGAASHRVERPRRLSDPLASGADWGRLQTVVDTPERQFPILWIWALPNPAPDRRIRELRLESRASDTLVVCGLTLFHGLEHPLRFRPLTLYRIALPPGAKRDEKEWQVEVDLGVVARSYLLDPFQPAPWLADPRAGLGDPRAIPSGAAHLYVEVAAAPDATLWLKEARTGKRHAFELAQAAAGRELAPRSPGPRIDVVEERKTWVHGRVLDAGTGRTAAARLSLRNEAGIYLPPHGHRRDVNDAWFQDYGADVRVHDSAFAYVDGTFQAELPVGAVYVELTRGFEYAPVRRRLEIRAGQRQLDLEIARFADFQSQGWVTADPHVHFLSPSTALLEAQAEGVNLVHLLAAQWGDLFTNVGDLAFGPLVSSDRQTIVWPGTENRQHVLGHIGALGGRGPAVQPLSSSGPPEAWVGEPLRATLSDWADRARAQDGLAVAMHFPFPTGEVAADVVMGKIDAVELYPYGFENVRFYDWYRYLNCGYRLTAVAGTDKMAANIPIGANRTYAWLGSEEFDFASWARAVRRGRTFITTGPLLLLRVEDRIPGDEISLAGGSARLEAAVSVRSAVPFHRVELLHNGRVAAVREEPLGTRSLDWREHVDASGPGWLAARCSSRLAGGPLGLQVAAHTSPVYLTVPGRELFSRQAAGYLLNLIEGTELWAGTLATRADPETHARIMRFFADARERIHARIHQHG